MVIDKLKILLTSSLYFPAKEVNIIEPRIESTAWHEGFLFNKSPRSLKVGGLPGSTTKRVTLEKIFGKCSPQSALLISRSISSTSFGHSAVKTSGPFSVIKTSSSILMPIPRYLRSKNNFIIEPDRYSRPWLAG